MSKKHKKVCATLNYIEHFILVSVVTGCISISAFASLFCIPIGIKIYVIYYGLKICAITAEIEKCKVIIKKKKNLNKIVLLAKAKQHASVNFYGFNRFEF